MQEKNELFVKPSPGLRVRNPDRGGELLAAEGEAVPNNSYWLRRLRDGDVQEAQVPRAQGRAGAADVQEAQVPRAVQASTAMTETKKKEK